MANDGGTAFPVGTPHKADCIGQSLLEYYAGKALVGLLAGHDGPTCPWILDGTPEPVAKAAFDIAEAMVAEAAKRKS